MIFVMIVISIACQYFDLFFDYCLFHSISIESQHYSFNQSVFLLETYY